MGELGADKYGALIAHPEKIESEIAKLENELNKLRKLLRAAKAVRGDDTSNETTSA